VAPLLLAISPQAANDSDLFSTWLDDAEKARDPRVVSHVYSAPEGCDLLDRAAWLAANPAMAKFRSVTDLEDFANRAVRLPSSENSFRWLYLNQRVEATAPFVQRSVWAGCNLAPRRIDDVPVYGGLDLSEVRDLTALVLIGKVDDVWQVHPEFWLPKEGLREKSRLDRVPYDVWSKHGHLHAVDGKSVDYEFVAHRLKQIFDEYDIAQIAFDRWNFQHLKPCLVRAGISEKDIEHKFVEFGQGYKSMSPALRQLEILLTNEKIAHGDHPVMTMCAMSAVLRRDPQGNRKLDKIKSTGRIDGMVALAMAVSVATIGKEVEREKEYRVHFF
jgi:phage terminase large subunit-like protein